ncbi:unnamed protein product [Meloidogyne enterolobii]|uniref:Uncharacterized protein n=1 Tax=Meloidogyne enterolobii TaxID=390850 RepID=A0ACB0Y8K6_MELEN
MSVKLFDRKRRCLDNHLKQNDQITAVSGFGTIIVVGTYSGMLMIFNTCPEGSSAEWELEANICLSEEKVGSRSTSYTNLLCFCNRAFNYCCWGKST